CNAEWQEAARSHLREQPWTKGKAEREDCRIETQYEAAPMSRGGGRYPELREDEQHCQGEMQHCAEWEPHPEVRHEIEPYEGKAAEENHRQHGANDTEACCQGGGEWRVHYGSNSGHGSV